MGRLHWAVVLFAVIFLYGTGHPARGQDALDKGAAPGSQHTDKRDPSARRHADFSRGSSQDQLARGQGQFFTAPRSSLRLRAVPSSVGGLTIGQLSWLGGYPSIYSL